jgi:hypothetical protein
VIAGRFFAASKARRLPKANCYAVLLLWPAVMFLPIGFLKNEFSQRLSGREILYNSLAIY